MIGITKADVFEAANILVAKGTEPTQESVRVYLGRGSKGTIHKYLKAWKWACFQAYQNQSAAGDSVGPKKWATEKRRLEEIIKTQMEQNEKISSELVDSELENASLKEQVKKLEKELTQSRENTLLKEGEAKAVQEALVTLKEERNEVLQHILEDKNQQIESLREEIKALNTESRKEAIEAGYKAQEDLINERVINVNLKEKIKGLEKTVSDLQQRLIQTQIANQRLKSSG